MAAITRRIATAIKEPVNGFWDVPDRWRWERLDVAAPVNPKRTLAGLQDEDEVAFIPMAAVGEFGSGIDVSSRRPVGSVKTGYTRMYSGDVALAKITPCMENGKLAIVPDVPHGRAAGTTEFHILEPLLIRAKYLFYWLHRQSFRQDAEHNMTGTAGQKRVPTDWLRSYPIPVPPLDVQDNIISRVDNLLMEVDAGAALLSEISLADQYSGLVDTLRQSILAAAFRGDLK